MNMLWLSILYFYSLIFLNQTISLIFADILLNLTKSNVSFLSESKEILSIFNSIFVNYFNSLQFEFIPNTNKFSMQKSISFLQQTEYP